MSREDLIREVEETREEILGFRRDFHMHPELGFEVNRTAKVVADLLRDWGIEVHSGIGKTGVVGILKGKTSGKVVALRADMDALPIKEDNDLSFKSKYEGKMHACAHDGHTAMLLGAAKVLSNHRDKINGTVKFIFQPAEEGPTPGGAKPMIEDGALEGVDEIYGIHLTTLHPTGVVGINRGSAMASTDIFEIELIGKGGHAGLPHEAVDAIAMASKVVSDIQYMVSRENDPLEPLVVSIGTINGGFASNVIAGNVTMTGTIRTQSHDLRKKIIDKMETIVKYITKSSGGEYKLNIIPGLPPLINDIAKASFVEDVSKRLLGGENIIILDKPNMGAEDFAYFLERVPGAFIWLGARNEAKGKVYLMHHPKFDFDEDALSLGTKLHITMALDALD